MYLKSLRVQNLKLVRSLALSFTNPDGSPRMWTVLVGENGLCKTTLLQAIALAVAGHERGNQLARADALVDQRQDEPAELDAVFTFSNDRHQRRSYPGLEHPPNPPDLESTVRVGPRSSVLTASSRYPGRNSSLSNPLSEARGNLFERDGGRLVPLADWFVASYGVGRALYPPMSSPQSFDAQLARFKGLFDVEHQLLGLRFADVLDDPKAYAKALQTVFVEKGILPRVKHVELGGRHGVRGSNDLLNGPRFEWNARTQRIKLPAVWLSQGYQSIVAWIADLLGHAFWEAQETFDVETLEGLVLVDELDLHLHPQWQVDLVPKLKETFKRVQFVVTTHSPMLLPGFTRDEIVRLQEDADGNVIAVDTTRSPQLMTGSEIYDEFFGIHQLYPTDLGRDLKRYGYLAANPYRSEAEEPEVKALRERLRRSGIVVGFEPVPRVTST